MRQVRTFLVLLGVLALLLTGCAKIQIPGITAPTVLPPDYNTPDTAFVHADFNKLATEFIDVYAGQYVVFEGLYVSHRQGALLKTASGQLMNASDLMSMQLYDAGRLVTVVWSVADKELGLPLLSLSTQKKVRIYGYVVPVGKKTGLKTRRDIIHSPFGQPVILLIRAVPLGA